MVEFRELHGGESVEDEFEQELRSALQPQPAPEGFADRVVALAKELPRAGTLQFRVRRPVSRHLLRWSIAAVLLLTVTLGGLVEHQRQRRAAGERARQQVLLALRITGITLHAVRDRIDKNGTN